MREIIFVLPVVLFFFTSSLTQVINQENNKIPAYSTTNSVQPPQIVIDVNKHKNVYDSILRKNNMDILEKNNKLENITSSVEELLHLIEDNKNELLKDTTPEDYGLKIKTEIMNATDEHVLNLLLNNEEDKLKETKAEQIGPIIVVLPQPLSDQESLYYDKYKDLIKDVEPTKSLLLRVIYFEKIATIKSQNKKEATDELENTKDIIKKCESRINAIKAILDEISYNAYGNEDKTTKRLKSEKEFLNQKLNVLNRKIRKLERNYFKNIPLFKS
ncbi:uncharacterized protein LOC111530065 isoform X2 [Piliocolobus tephrosceles]|uniref:uncharacterized protein LOC111530065 isoform X2 n=1 Tax=Piliocolobus tephrosceles TaxID=591936 RepID=UPI000E6B4C19|nr:uncharacterized protein LOC111530065 isoform X2 [Piliocolobus tephrosceles]